MNKDNILALADVIENAVEGRRKPKVGFNMGTFYASNGLERDMTGHNCGTTACIAGWAAMHFDRSGRKYLGPIDISDLNNFKIRAIAAEALGLDYNTAEALFIPAQVKMDRIGPKRAVRTLRRLANTGSVDWGKR